MSPNDFRLIIPALGCWGMTVLVLLGPTGAGAAGVAGSVGLCVAAVVWSVRRPRHWLLAAPIIATAGLAAGVGAAALIRLDAVENHPLRADVGHRTSVQLVVTDDPQWLAPNKSRLRVAVSVRGAGRTGDRRVRPVRAADAVVMASGDRRGEWVDVWPGQRLSAVVAVRAPPGHDLTVVTLSPTSPPRLLDAGPWYQRVSATIRWRFAQVAQRALGDRAAGLLPGLVLGDTSGIGDDVRADFRSAGLSHLLAVSGANFALITGAAILLIRLAGAGPRTTAVVGVIAIIGFAILVRPSASVVRAAAMGIVAVLAMAASRRAQAMPALAAAIIVAVVWRPSLALDVGFAMSVAASAALIAWGGPAAEWLRAHRVPNGLAQLLAMAAVAQAATAPWVAMISGGFSVVGVPANVVVAPVVAIISVLGAIAALAASLPGPGELCGELLIRALAPELWWMLGCARFFGSAAIATLPLPDGIAGAFLAAGLVAVGAGVVSGVWQHRRGGGPLTSVARRRRLPGRPGDRRGRRGGARGRGGGGWHQPDPGG